MIDKRNDRVVWIDIAKGIAMLCIILGHMGLSCIERIVFTFHVPIFFLISGYFLSLKSDIRSFFTKKVRALLMPYIFTSCLLLFAILFKDIVKGLMASLLPDAIRVVIQAIYGSGSTHNLTLFSIDPIGAIWFLFALLWALLLVKCFIDKRYGFLWIVLIAIVSYITSRCVWLPFDIQAGGTGAIFTYVGAYFKKQRIISFKWWIVCAGTLALIVEVLFNINLSIARNYFKYGLISVIGALLISYMVLWISKMLDRSKLLKEFFSFWGRNSIIVLCYHLVFINNAPLGKIYLALGGLPSAVQYIICFLIQLVFIVFCTWLTLRVGLLRKIFNK